MANPNLLGLPLELRWKVLRNCLVIGVAQIPSPPTGEPFRISKPEASSQLLRVCQQIYNEAFPILYQENIIFCRNATYLESFVTQKAPSTRSMIRHICIAGQTHHRLSAQLDNYLPFFESLPNLRSLNIFLSRVSDIHQGPRCIIMATANTMSLSAPSQTFVERLSRQNKPVDLGAIKCVIHPMSKHSTLETELDGEALIRYRIVLAAHGHTASPLEAVVGLQLAFASQDRDWTSFLPKLRGHELGEDNPVVWYGSNWRRLLGMDELLRQRKNWWFMKNRLDPSMNIVASVG
ncbi:Heat shock protein 60 [Venturia nashicola]|uniref:Heat shock protein 60 n=1 Tax=Venturia nashicola TaxID=86259 RepID=A0A4Z1NY79_9PEZI|nr:Heat shock protein 60 [Venturia nashicola]TLD23613.1 Heat shock protein 60 [Venturia nashicola]